tara:strand:- start:297 stop:413 length:117 start_codon:yes stop_codon:yes gene_type:complete
MVRRRRGGKDPNPKMDVNKQAYVAFTLLILLMVFIGRC